MQGSLPTPLLPVCVVLPSYYIWNADFASHFRLLVVFQKSGWNSKNDLEEKTQLSKLARFASDPSPSCLCCCTILTIYGTPSLHHKLKMVCKKMFKNPAGIWKSTSSWAFECSSRIRKWGGGFRDQCFLLCDLLKSGFIQKIALWLLVWSEQHYAILRSTFMRVVPVMHLPIDLEPNQLSWSRYARFAFAHITMLMLAGSAIKTITIPLWHYNYHCCPLAPVNDWNLNTAIYHAKPNSAGQSNRSHKLWWLVGNRTTRETNNNRSYNNPFCDYITSCWK